MAGPWEKYAAPAAQPPVAGPWQKYAAPAQASPLQERIANARVTPEAAARASAADQIAQDQMTLSRTGPVLSALTKFNQGLPFIGQWTDEATGAVGNALGLDGERITQDVRATQDAMGRQYPKTSLALQVAGGVTGSLAAAPAAMPLIRAGASPASLMGRAATSGAIAAGAGATEGAISGAGAGVEGERGQSAMTGAAVGGVLGGAVGAAAPVLGAGIKAIAEGIKGRDVTTISRVLGIDKGAARVIRDSLAADDFVAAERALKRAGGEAMLADAGVASSQLLDTAASASGEAAKIARGAVETRATKAGKRLTTILDSALGKPEGVRAAAKGIASRTTAVRQAAYDRAYNSAIDYAGDAGRNIEGVLSRIPTKTMRAAIDEANDAMKAAGVKNRQIMAEIADDGAVTFREMPNVQQLDEIKKALGSIGQNETDAVTGRVSGAGVRAKKLASDLRDALAEAVPSYRTAVKLGGDKIQEDQALDLGRRLLLSGTTREQVAETMNGASKEAVAAARRGVRSYIDDTLANVQRTITDPNVDAREAMKAVKDLSSKANQTKITAIMGEPRAKVLFDAIDEVTAHLELRGAIARNSATASRMAGKEAIDQIAEPNALQTLMAGEPVQASKKLIQFFTGQTGEVAAARKQEIYAQIADALTQKRGKDAEVALRIVQRAIAGQPATTAQAALIARALTTGVALPAYQTGQQYLTNQLGGR